MFCEKCGKEIPNDSIFCEKCGCKIEGEQETKSGIEREQTTNKDDLNTKPDTNVARFQQIGTLVIIIGFIVFYWNVLSPQAQYKRIAINNATNSIAKGISAEAINFKVISATKTNGLVECITSSQYLITIYGSSRFYFAYKMDANGYSYAYRTSTSISEANQYLNTYTGI